MEKKDFKPVDRESRFAAPDQGPAKDLDEIHKMEKVVHEALGRMIDAGSQENPSDVIALDPTDLEGYKNYLQQKEQELSEEEKFYLKAKIHLLELEK